ncbi:MAG: hypothetical protein R2838_10555 [Caldilineaceae bacterium]
MVANKFLTGLRRAQAHRHVRGQEAARPSGRPDPLPSQPQQRQAGQRTEDLFVLDFFNTVGDIKDAFDPYYTATTLSGPTDVNVLHDLKDVGRRGRLRPARRGPSSNDLFNKRRGRPAQPHPRRLRRPLRPRSRPGRGRAGRFQDQGQAVRQNLRPSRRSPALQPRAPEMLFLVSQVSHSQAPHRRPRPRPWTFGWKSVDLPPTAWSESSSVQSIGLDAAETEVEPPNPNSAASTVRTKPKTRWMEIIRFQRTLVHRLDARPPSSASASPST